ncbi:peptidoglycan-binding protein [Frigoribacterium sp. CFBP9030]|uniref:peptidoglycan-binding protein n=1 Tax=Frigoribacterium sp. CFBP9030 TaxID=3096537 RepID=UPI002A6AD054|nr:peptidoglycan-binding protein [Frigoribacterium sp. CFBP9030]MDY0893076.1 peptidoglycan-binding protein [Frigoribacterium sp. CFBP9030]
MSPARQPDRPPVHRPAHRRALVGVVAGALCVAALTGCSLIEGGAGGSAPSASAVGAQRPTAPVVLGDLVDGKRIPAALGYGTPVPLTSAGTGVVTGLPAFGEEIGRDGVLYSVDESPVRAMHGAVPLWRPLVQGLRGADVTQLKENLRALGYEVSDGEWFDSSTRDAVTRWQTDRGRTRTGGLDASDIAFVPGDIRVADPIGRVGDEAGSAVYGYTPTALVVTASVSPPDLARFPGGGPVEVRLPDGTTVPGSVQAVGEPSGGAGDDPAPGGDDEVVVTVGLDGDPPEGTSTSTAVDLVVDGERREGVLSVPVTALLAGDDGYVVEVVRSGGETERVPVTTGLFAQGRAEVSGDGLAEGDEVVVPS